MQTTPCSAAYIFHSTSSSLADFYSLIGQLSNMRFIRFAEKQDEIDSITWTFTYHKRRFVLQYSIYNGISLLTQEARDGKLATKLANKLQISQS